MKTACPCVEDLVQVIRINASFSLDELLALITHIYAHCGKPSLAHNRLDNRASGSSIACCYFRYNDVQSSLTGCAFMCVTYATSRLVGDRPTNDRAKARLYDTDNRATTTLSSHAAAFSYPSSLPS